MTIAASPRQVREARGVAIVFPQAGAVTAASNTTRSVGAFRAVVTLKHVVARTVSRRLIGFAHAVARAVVQAASRLTA